MGKTKLWRILDNMVIKAGEESAGIKMMIQDVTRISSELIPTGVRFGG